MIQYDAFGLAGGQSRRFAGDKRLLEIGGVRLLDHQIGLLQKSGAERVALVGDHIPNASDLGISILADARPGCGPLGGLITALEECRQEWAMVLAVDLPFLTAGDLYALADTAASAEDDIQVITLGVDELPEPLAAMYRKNTLAFWVDRLAHNELALHRGIDHLQWKMVAPVSGKQALENLNTVADHDRIKKLLKRRP
jgi:molybdopterin-guanine dinucleotide biosynthesis protein A